MEIKTAPSFEQNLFDEKDLLEYVKVLSSDAFEGRRTGSEGAALAREFIIDAFKSANVDPFLDSYEQSFSFDAEGQNYKGVNVLGQIKGSEYPEKYIVVSGHYDHVGINKGVIYNGADDNASSIGALLAMAQYFERNPPKHSIILAAFDAEELGLKGAYYFVDQAIQYQLNIVFNVNMDMISRNERNELYVVGLNFFEPLKTETATISFPNDFNLVLGHDGLDGKMSWLNSSDHTPFYKQGIPFLYFGVEDHSDYHRPTDDFEKIRPEFYVKSVYSILTILLKIDDLSF